jgi:hypothetical protein
LLGLKKPEVFSIKTLNNSKACNYAGFFVFIRIKRLLSKQSLHPGFRDDGATLPSFFAMFSK